MQSVLGYYRVKDRIISNKVAALVYGTEVDYHPDWIFNNDIFDHYNWSVSPVEPLDELYRERAQQIRDRYDYVALSYSAGSDSQNILNTFLKHNICLDEVVVTWAVEQAERTAADPTDISFDNVISEWELTVKPKLKWLAQYHPNIKITINDWASRLDKVSISDEYLLTRNHMFFTYGDLRWDSVKIFDHINKKKGVLVYGLDKPRVCVHEGSYQLYFVDAAAHSAMPSSDENKQSIELFYWSPDSCKILAKQAHMVADFFDLNPQFHQYIQWPIFSPQYKQFYESVLRPLIYPEVDLRIFQANKPTSTTIGHENLVLDTELEQPLKVASQINWEQLRTIVDKKYFVNNAGETTLTGFINGMWPIRKIKEKTHG